jgi:hypothetical protein
MAGARFTTRSNEPSPATRAVLGVSRSSLFVCETRVPASCPFPLPLVLGLDLGQRWPGPSTVTCYPFAYVPTDSKVTNAGSTGSVEERARWGSWDIDITRIVGGLPC